MYRRVYCGLIAMTALSGCSALSDEFSNDDVGESYEMESGIELTVDQVEIQTGGTITFGDGRSISGGSNAITFVMVHFMATNTTESPQSMPLPADFDLLTNAVRQETYQSDIGQLMDTVELSISDPVSGPLFPPRGEIAPDEELDGWLVFTVPEAGPSGVLELRVDDDVVMEWSLLLE